MPVSELIFFRKSASSIFQTLVSKFEGSGNRSTQNTALRFPKCDEIGNLCPENTARRFPNTIKIGNRRAHDNPALVSTFPYNWKPPLTLKPNDGFHFALNLETGVRFRCEGSFQMNPDEEIGFRIKAAASFQFMYELEICVQLKPHAGFYFIHPLRSAISHRSCECVFGVSKRCISAV